LETHVSSKITPVNLSATHVASVVGNQGQAEEPPAPPEAADLDNWQQENYNLSVDSALTLGFAVAGVDATTRSQVLVFGIARWKDVESTSGQVYRYGVSLRAVVEVRDYKGDGSLTIPLVAAKVQLEGAKATASLVVRGYKGTITLPHWESFDVASYGEYQKAISSVQDQITSDSGNIVPELLATTAGSALIPRPTSAVGTVLALEAISRGDSLNDALRDLARHTQDDEVQSTVRKVYNERVNGGDSPDPEMRQRARDDLHGIHLSHGLLQR
jgi:hypothetical protein